MAAQQLMDSGIAENKIDIAVRGASDRNDTMGTPPDNNLNTPSNNLETDNRTNATATDMPENKRDNDFFSSLFDSRDESNKYYEVARHGSIVTVHTDSKEESKRVAEMLDKAGAIDVNERAEQYRGMSTSSKGKWTDAKTTIPVVEEKMEVGKREVETGGVQLRSRIVERPVEEHLRLREEHVNIERNPVNRPANERDLANFKEGERTIVEHGEVPLVNKEARVVEEVKLNKKTTERDETIRGNVRKQDIDVDKLDKDKDKRDLKK